MFKRSDDLDEVLAEVLKNHRKRAILEEMLTITTGYDNDGCDGIEMVETGIELGLEMAKMALEKGKAECWLACYPPDNIGWPLIVESENDAIAFISSIGEGEEDEEDEDDEEDDWDDEDDEDWDEDEDE